MTSPDDDAAPAASPAPETYPDRVYRSTGGIAGGVLLLAVGGWLGIDAMIRGEGRIPWLALAGLLCAVPVVIAFTVRPAVYAGQDRLLVRNPFRTITLPWASVEGLRAGYTSEVLAGGATYQLWAIPVSLRQRKRAARQQARAASEDPFGSTSAHVAAGRAEEDRRAPSDAAIGDLREMAETNAQREGAQGAPEVRWAFEVIAPTVAGAVLLGVMLAIG
ncbi:PH domain-containing protein [Streptomyces sp. NPDC044780]|uniref:PH domain-containing protein n=1 Tax=Streptomyces luomodiensis TaxID=3026192 RepID=A0ABY9UWY5_9ACTN|nr:MULTISPECIES: PH domain-containing protein [unclassified Streptomyces]WAP56527.1 PH domain-containing protein [Streptomyces sp. S465]WNE97077.1 PH domain-containing protein [Streptomyces sp. SCA4-21]